MAKKNERIGELESVIAAMDKQFGKGTVMRFGDGPVERVPTFPSGSMNLDLALGIGGVPRGRIIEVFGPESSGKTTLALEMIAQVQRAGGTAAFVDAEHALDLGYAQRLGVAIEDLLLSQPDCGEQALDIVEALVRSSALDLVVIDSVAALTPRAEIEGDMGDSHVGLQARLMSQALRKLVAACHRQECSVLFINQMRMKIGVMFGSPETTTGGNALKFYASIRLDVRRIGSQKTGTEVTGNRVKVKVVKNKMAPPFTEAEFDIVFGEGVNHTLELVELGERLGVIDKSGSWLSFGGEHIGQGRDQADRRLRTDDVLRDTIESAIRKALDARRESGLSLVAVPQSVAISAPAVAEA
jgi:recombination protein RecA